MNLGKADLLAWLNHIVEAEYMAIQSLADGIAYAQLLDAIHPGCLPLIRLNFTPKYPQDNLRNLKIVEDALKKLKISQPASFDKMAKGMFQDNIIFLQWLYNYSKKNATEAMMDYEGFNKRQKMLQRQGKACNEMNLHLMPTNRYQQQWQAGQQAQQEVQISSQVNSRIQHVDEYVHALQTDLKDMMQINWKMMFNVDKSIEERNSLYNLLDNINRALEEQPKSLLKDKIREIVREVSPQFE